MQKGIFLGLVTQTVVVDGKEEIMKLQILLESWIVSVGLCTSTVPHISAFGSQVVQALLCAQVFHFCPSEHCSCSHCDHVPPWLSCPVSCLSRQRDDCGALHLYR
ncbi:expressed unknown protein [Seminavis robusta]|uniref:Uncharacterized protein n=1 Tax=Seminavis robusta TaxID=568900 RepID=A0A9N8EFX5_9STRA|nr:expressed unknown protein [Seminavis robusta]|eukprot:Sro1036_g234041.1  (105) ;mRNA; f:13611-13925